mmetsp:Transcript_59229/g.152392  ORF Transcript_59229/g.152392 Transcript_59229/m.152392 type:complete len:206 (-) Transcript_59229:62-679(-)
MWNRTAPITVKGWTASLPRGPRPRAGGAAVVPGPRTCWAASRLLLGVSRLVRHDGDAIRHHAGPVPRVGERREACHDEDGDNHGQRAERQPVHRDIASLRSPETGGRLPRLQQHRHRPACRGAALAPHLRLGSHTVRAGGVQERSTVTRISGRRVRMVRAVAVTSLPERPHLWMHHGCTCGSTRDADGEQQRHRAAADVTRYRKL